MRECDGGRTRARFGWIGAMAAAVTIATACASSSPPPPTPLPRPTPAPLPTVPRPALDTPVAQATGASGPSVQVTHEVRPGETLGQIAAQYYGNANQWQPIFEANRGVITDPNSLTAGARLVIPRPEAAPTRAP